jgi:uncharacterized membrane protein
MENSAPLNAPPIAPLNAHHDNPPAHPYNKHRIEALSDGIFAVTMTLLVIELKLPEHGAIQTNLDLVNAVANLTPKFLAWLISFFVLSLFWIGHHRIFHYVRHVDGTFLSLCLVQLGFASLMPFSSALSGEYAGAFFSQIFYSINMACLALFALLMARYIFRHHELTVFPMPAWAYKSIRIRTIGVMIISAVAIIIAAYLRPWGNSAFVLMIVIGIVVRRIEARNVKLSAIIKSTDSPNSTKSA